MIRNALTIDLEEWFHICGMEPYLSSDDWPALESRVWRGMHALLRLLDETGHRATFFVLGWVAERHPNLVERIHREGHEVACHGYSHRRVFEMTPLAFRRDMEQARDILCEITGEAPLGFRAPEWSLKEETSWALDVIRKLGFAYDCSMLPSRILGRPRLRKHPHVMMTMSGRLWEFPLSTVRFGRTYLPFSAGFSFRIWPEFLVRRWFRQANEHGVSVMLALHPWEMDPDHPRIWVPFPRSFLHYYGLRGARARAERILREFRFAPVIDLLQEQAPEVLEEVRRATKVRLRKGEIPVRPIPRPLRPDAT